MKISTLGEFGLISELMGDAPPHSPKVIRGVGDDAAVLRQTSGMVLLATCDAQIEGVHFSLKLSRPEQIGRRAAAVNLSDIAAMGGTPTFALASIGLPAGTDSEMIKEIYQGLRRGLALGGAELVGGNTAELRDQMMIDITLLGEVKEDQILCRDGAKVGDLICTTGSLGRSSAGLLASQRTDLGCDPEMVAPLVDRHLVPQPRLKEGRVLATHPGVTSCIDLSDGLLGDARHIAEMSRVSLAIEAERLPISPSTRIVAQAARADLDALVLQGGEDFELLFTVAPNSAKELLDRLNGPDFAGATTIGRVTAGRPEVIVTRKGQPLTLNQKGYEHFVGSSDRQ